MEDKYPQNGYLLFVFGDLMIEGMQEEIASTLLPITSNEKLKYIFGSYHMVVNMDTDIPFDELKEFIYETLKSERFEYFLMPTSDKSSVKLPTEMAQHLFDLENNNENVHIFTQENVEKIKMRDKQSDDELDLIINYFLSNTEGLTFDDVEMEEDEDDDPLIRKVRQKSQRPTVDQLLEKIADEGMDSLSADEKQLLDEYANEK